MVRAWKQTDIKTIHSQHQKAHQTQQKFILDEFCQTYQCYRKLDFC